MFLLPCVRKKILNHSRAADSFLHVSKEIFPLHPSVRNRILPTFSPFPLADNDLDLVVPQVE